MRGKKAQFYLLAAVIIIAIIIGFAATTNYIRKNPNVAVYDLGEQAGIESENVIEHGLINNKDNLQDFTEQFSEYAGEGKELYFLFGDNEGLYVASYEQILTGETSLIVGGGSITLKLLKDKYRISEEKYKPQDDGKIKIKIEEDEFEFELEEGQNFYFVISQEIGGDKYVATS